MVGYDAKISPSYICKVSPEEVDGKIILVIWAPAGINRPYSVMESVVAKKSVPKFYVRSKSSTIEARGEILDGMDLLVGPVEHRQIKNVAAMMFCDNPEKFFPVTQVDIVHFPEGSIENPDFMIETPKSSGLYQRLLMRL